MNDEKKVFQIGFNRCGVTFLYHFLNDLGYNMVHWDGGGLALTMEHNLKCGKRLLEGYDNKFNAFLYMEHVDFMRFGYFHYKQMDKDYPNSKFILNTRDLDTWMEKKMEMTHDVECYMKYFKLDNEKELKDCLRKQWIKHHVDVLNYFGEKRIGKDLLVYDVDKDNPRRIYLFLNDDHIAIQSHFQSIYQKVCRPNFTYSHPPSIEKDLKMYCVYMEERKEDITNTFQESGLLEGMNFCKAIIPSEVDFTDGCKLSTLYTGGFPRHSCDICTESEMWHPGIYGTPVKFCVHLSYLLCLYDSISRDNNENGWTLIFEDDIYFTMGKEELIKIYRECKEYDYDVVYIGFGHCKDGDKLVPLNEGDMIVQLPFNKNIVCKHAIIYKNEYIKNVFQDLLPQLDCSDVHFNHVNMLRKAKVGIARKPFVFQDRRRYGSFNNNEMEDEIPLYG